MAITELLAQLEKAVATAKTKQDASEKANVASAKAGKEFSDSLIEVDKLKQEVTDAIGNIFPSSNRIRQAS